jgi:hypothetical protein
MKFKTLLLSAVLVLPLTLSAEPKTKKVCTDVKDKNGQVVKTKDGKNKQTCKEIKVRKKVEGKDVPDNAKK